MRRLVVILKAVVNFGLSFHELMDRSIRGITNRALIRLGWECVAILVDWYVARVPRLDMSLDLRHISFAQHLGVLD